MQAPGEKLEILAYLLQQHEDIIMPTLFTMSNAEQIDIRTNYLYYWATREKRDGQGREKREKGETESID